MTDEERAIWRGAFDLYEWNKDMPDTEDAWTAFIRSLTDFANRHSWQTCPLAHRLFEAVLAAVEDGIRKRREEEAARPKQMSFFGEASG